MNFRSFVEWLKSLFSRKQTAVEEATVSDGSHGDEIRPAADATEVTQRADAQTERRRSKRDEPSDSFQPEDADDVSLDAFLAEARHLIKIVNERRQSFRGRSRVTKEDWVSASLAGIFVPYVTYFRMGGITEDDLNDRVIDVSAGLPTFVCVGGGRARDTIHPAGELPSKPNSTPNNIETVSIIKRLDRLPPGYFPTGPGYPYELYEVGFNPKKYKDMEVGLAAFSSYFTIEANGTIHRAAHWVQSSSYIRTRHNGTVCVPRCVRSVASYYDDPKEWGEAGLERKVTHLFKLWSWRDRDWTATFATDGCRIVLGAPPERLRQLFSSRDSRVNRHGRIVHWVTAHERKTGQVVRTHIRGQRTFKVDEFDVEIAIPGKHQPMATEESGIEFVGTWATSDPISYLFGGSKLLALLSRAGIEQLDKQMEVRDQRIERGELTLEVQSCKTPIVAIRYDSELKPVKEVFATDGYASIGYAQDDEALKELQRLHGLQMAENLQASPALQA
jgi:hypothetical protein